MSLFCGLAGGWPHQDCAVSVQISCWPDVDRCRVVLETRRAVWSALVPARDLQQQLCAGCLVTSLGVLLITRLISVLLFPISFRHLLACCASAPRSSSAVCWHRPECARLEEPVFSCISLSHPLLNRQLYFHSVCRQAAEVETFSVRPSPVCLCLLKVALIPRNSSTSATGRCYALLNTWLSLPCYSFFRY